MTDQKRTRLIFGLLAFALVAFLVSLPWQMAQWRALEKTREETRQQEARVAELRAGGSDAPTTADPEARVVAAGERAARDGATRSLLAELDALRAAPLTPEGKANLAGVYQSIEYWDAAYPLAREAVAEARKAGQTVPSALLRLGYLEMLLGYRQSALPLFREAAGAAPGDAGSQVALALAYDQATDVSLAEKSLRTALEREPGNVPARLLLAQNLTRQNRTPDALRELDAAAQVAPTDPRVPLQRAETLYADALRQPPDRRADALRRAATEVENALRLDPRQPPAHFLKGNILVEQGNLAGARREWEGLYGVSPNYPRLRFQLGQLYLRAGERQKGNDLLKAFRETDARETEYNRLVTSVGMSKGDPARRRELARWCAANGRLSRAILEWEQILEKLPNDAEARRESARLRAERERGLRP
jgi:predicted Zn-dependent protease